jgi:hypothetical protein
MRARARHAGEAKARSTLDAVAACAREFEPVQILFDRVKGIVTDLVRTPQAGQRPAGSLDCAVPQGVVCDCHLPIIGAGDLLQPLPVLGPERLGCRRTVVVDMGKRRLERSPARQRQFASALAVVRQCQKPYQRP